MTCEHFISDEGTGYCPIAEAAMRERDAERALADQLAHALRGAGRGQLPLRAGRALAAYERARSRS